MGPRFCDIVDEISGNGDLSSCIAELSKSGVKEAVLLPKRLDCSICVSLLGLKGHICIGDFRYRRAVGKSAVLDQMLQGTHKKKTTARKKAKQAMAK